MEGSYVLTRPFRGAYGSVYKSGLLRCETFFHEDLICGPVPLGQK